MRILSLLSLLASLVLVSGCDGSTVRDRPDGSVCTDTGACETVYPITSRAHVPEPVDYDDRPPAGGPHSSCWTEFGVHATEVPDERFVHNLEHGAIVYLYRCPEGCATEQASLEALADGRPFVVVLPYAEMTSRFAALAWGYRLLTDTLDLDAFVAFHDEHVDRAPESITAPPPGSCSLP